jgi:membrane protein DedA with SNARE-associated domain/membrane-associated phospholipid phosphatase
VKWGPLLFAIALAAFLWWRRRTMGRVELGFGVLVVAALAVYSTGVIHLPNVEHLIEDLGQALGPWTYLLVGVMAFLETGAFVGLIAPGETTILVGGVVAGQGQINIFALIALVWFCAVAGDVTSFMLGRKLGRGFLEKHGPKVKITHERLIQVEHFFDRHGGKAVLIGRFVGLIRAIAPFIAGSSKMPLRRFLPYDIIGAGLWGTTFCILGYVFWQSFGTVADYAGRGALALGTVIVVVVGTITVVRWLRVPENREAAHQWLHEQAERPMLRPVARVVRPIVYRVLAPVSRRLVGPARFTLQRFTPGDLGLEVTTLFSIAAVGSFVFVALAFSVGPGDPALFSDRRAFQIADDIRMDWLVDVSKVVSAMGTMWVLTPVCLAAAAVLAHFRRWPAVAVLVVGTVLVVVADHIAKAVVARPRPAGSLVETSGDSYPSGHAAQAVAWVAAAVLLSRFVPWLAGRAALVVAAIVIAVAVGLSRVYLDAHYLSDVLGGWGLAATIYAVCGIVAMVVAHARHNRVVR